MKSTKVENEKRKTTRNPKFSTTEDIPPTPKSPARNRKSSPVAKTSRRSPSRKSPSRKSPSRKSPSRKSPARKSPARKSPSRTKKEVVEDVPKSPSRRPAIKTNSVAIDKKSTTSLKSEIILPPLPTRSFRSEVILEDFSTKLKQYGTENQNGQDAFSSNRSSLRERKTRLPEDFGASSRRSTRLKEATESFEKILYKAQNTALPQGDFQYDDDADNYSEDDTPFKKDISVTRKLATPHREMSIPKNTPLEFGGTLGAGILMILLPLFVVLVNLSCTRSQCSFRSLPDLMPFKKFESWLTLRGVCIFFSFITIQCAVFLIPYFGRKATLPDSNQTWTCNGLFSIVVTLATLEAVEYFLYPVLQIFSKEYIPLMFSSLIFGLFISLEVFLLAGRPTKVRKNKFGDTGNKLYDFWVGRELNTNVLGVFPVKVLLIRSAVIAAFLMNCISVYHGLKFKKYPTPNPAVTVSDSTFDLDAIKKIMPSAAISPTLLVFTTQQLIFLLYSIIHERRITHSFDMQEEGTGYMLIMYRSLYPFIGPLITKYILEHNVVVSNISLVASTAVFFIGFFIYHFSNTQQYNFKQNPSDPKLCCLESTFGRRILISGLWGWVRHPNYLGEILMVLSWSFATSSAPPLLFIVFSVVLLVLKSRRDAARSHKNCGIAWDRYRRRVPYNLIPRVY